MVTAPKSEMQVVWGAVDLEAELLVEVSEDGAVEGDLDGLVPVRHHDPLARVEGEARTEEGATGQEAEDGVNVALVCQHHLVRVRRVYEDVTHVQPVERELDLGSDAQALDAQGKPGFPPRDVTEGGAGVLLCLAGFEHHRHLGAGVGPNIALHRLQLKHVVVKNHRVVLDQLQHKENPYVLFASSLHTEAINKDQID